MMKLAFTFSELYTRKLTRTTNGLCSARLSRSVFDGFRFSFAAFNFPEEGRMNRRGNDSRFATRNSKKPSLHRRGVVVTRQSRAL